MSKSPKKRKKESRNVSLILHNIRSVHNVGSIFRTSDAAGISKIYVTGYTPSPIDRFGKVRSDIAKTALGAEKTIPWEYIKTPITLIKKLRLEGFQVLAIEQHKNSVDYKKVKLHYPIAILVGNEVSGISKSLLDKCDIVAEIPMRGEKESLNVGVAFGIALFRILNI